jgi:hypothetical protein
MTCRQFQKVAAPRHFCPALSQLALRIIASKQQPAFANDDSAVTTTSSDLTTLSWQT